MSKSARIKMSKRLMAASKNGHLDVVNRLIEFQQMQSTRLTIPYTHEVKRSISGELTKITNSHINEFFNSLREGKYTKLINNIRLKTFDVNVQGIDKSTVLTMAAKYGRLDVAKLLLDCKEIQVV